MSARSLSERMKDAWSILFCQCKPVFIEKLRAAGDMQSAGSSHVCMLNGEPTIWWQCGQRLDHHASCPRFQAYRQGVAAGEERAQYLHMPGGRSQVEAEVSDGDGKAAEVENLNGNSSVTMQPNDVRNLHAHVDAISNPVSPGVVEAEHGAYHSNSQRDRLKSNRVHTASPAFVFPHYHQRAINWTLAALLALLLSIVWDGPTDAQAAADMAADVQDAIHAAQVAAK